MQNDVNPMKNAHGMHAHYGPIANNTNVSGTVTINMRFIQAGIKCIFAPDVPEKPLSL